MATTLTKTARTVVASTSNAAGATTRGTVDLRTAYGGFLTAKITNGSTGPTVQCTCNLLVAHTASATPTAASAGTDWKTVWSFGGGTTNNAITEQIWDVPAGVMHLEVEFIGNTGQAVTVTHRKSTETSGSVNLGRLNIDHSAVLIVRAL